MGTIKHYRNKYIPVLRKIIFIFFTCLGMYYTYDNLNKLEMELIDTDTELFSSYSPVYYIPLSDNTGYTNINGISNFVLNVIKDNYELQQDNSTNNYIDYIFIRSSDNSVWRLYYSFRNMYVAFLSSEYEASGKGFTYIIEKNEDMYKGM